MKFRRSDQLLSESNGNPSLRAMFKFQERVTRSCSIKRLHRYKVIKQKEFTKRFIDWPIHFEGGWDMESFDELDRIQYVKKLEKSEDINATIEKWGEKVSKDSTNSGSVTHLTWLGPAHVAAAYADTQFCHEWWKKSGNFYLWNLDRAEPLLTLMSPAQVTTVECDDTVPDILLTGDLAGRLALYDIRTGGKPIATSPEFEIGPLPSDFMHRNGHVGFVTVAMWTLSAGGNEIVSCGSGR
ncbi:hypothetical protein WDU94_007063 [Cyamophila willieti]